MLLELVTETTDQEIDIDATYSALTALLMSYHRKRQDRRAATT